MPVCLVKDFGRWCNKKSWVEKTIINSKYRLTYKEAQDIILGNSHKLNKEIKILNSIAQIFRKQRIKKGSVIIKQEETKIKFNKDNEPEKAIRKKTLLANQLVEEFMLIANKRFANTLVRIGLMFLEFMISPIWTN